jgi:signal peptidase II
LNQKYRLTVIIGSIVLFLDQVTKALVHGQMTLYQSIEIVPNFFHLTYLRNTGAAFGFLAGSRSPLRIIFFILISAMAIGCIFYLLKNLRLGQNTFAASLSLILGGAIGNLIDRLRMGEVIDFLDFHWYAHHWPAFNVADSAITIGVLLLFWQMIRKKSLTFG